MWLKKEKNFYIIKTKLMNVKEKYISKKMNIHI